MAEWESIIFSASRPGLIPSRGKTTPSAERQQWEWVSPLTSATAWEDPLCSNPVVTSIPFDSCVKPPSFHSSLLHKLNSYPPAGTRRGETKGDVRQFTLLLLLSWIEFSVLPVRFRCQRWGQGGAACPARAQRSCTTQCEKSQTALKKVKNTLCNLFPAHRASFTKPENCFGFLTFCRVSLLCASLK